MSRKLIEMVCTANNGRSPVAELVANNYLRQLQAEEYQAISSGTSVDEIQSGRIPTSFKIQTIDIAKQRGIYSSLELDDIQKAIQTSNDKAITYFYDKAVQVFYREERKHRAEALQEFGIDGIVKTSQDQTIVRPNAIAVFSMAQRNNEQVRQIYKDVLDQPIIEVLSRYATGDLTAEVPNAYGLGKDAYFLAIAKIVADVPKSIDMLL